MSQKSLPITFHLQSAIISITKCTVYADEHTLAENNISEEKTMFLDVIVSVYVKLLTIHNILVIAWAAIYFM